MSRREYDDRESDYYSRSRGGGREYRERDVDVSRSRYDGPSRRSQTVVKERESDTVVTQGHRTERGDRRLDFLDEDYGKNSHTGPLVVREERKVVEDDDVRSRGGRTVRKEKLEVDDEVYTRGPSRSGRSRGPAREEKEEIIFRERESSRPRRAPYPHSEQDFEEKEEIIFRERTRSRSRAPPSRAPANEEKIDIRIREYDSEKPVSRAPPLRSEFSERETEEIRFTRGRGDREPPSRGGVVEKETITIRERENESRAPPPRSEVVDKEEIVIKERRSSPSRDRRGRGVSKEEIDISIRERSAPPPRARSQSRGQLVAKKEEEWIIRRQRTPSPSPPPPPRDYEKEEIIIRRKIRTPSPEPEPVREPTPEPPPPPPLEPIYRPPIIQEVITHHRHIDHGVERARSPTPPPPPSPPSPPREDNLEIEIKRTGTRNGKRYEEDLVIEQDISERTERKDREVERSETREVSRRSVSVGSRGISTHRRYEEDDVVAEADYYNRKVSSRGYPGEAYNGATRDWGLVDVPPGTERVRMDGAGGGRQEIYWDRYAGERRGKFVTGERVFEEDFSNNVPSPARRRDESIVRETKITEKRVIDETSRGKTRDRLWTEITKDLVTKEAIEEMGYEFEETDDYFYVMEYLRYENVLKLVELTEDIRRERRQRIREIQWEREEAERLPKLLPPPPPVPAPPRSRYDERIYERETFRYDRDGRYRR